MRKKVEILVKEITINNGLAKLAEAEKDIAKKSQDMQVQVVEVELKEQDLSVKNAATAQLKKEVSTKEEKYNKNANIIKAKSEEVNHELATAKPKIDAYWKIFKTIQNRNRRRNL